MIEKDYLFYKDILTITQGRMARKLKNLYNFYYLKATNNEEFTYDDVKAEYITLDEMGKYYDLDAENEYYLKKIEKLNNIFKTETKTKTETVHLFLGQDEITTFEEINFSEETKKYLKNEYKSMKRLVKIMNKKAKEEEKMFA